MHAHNNEPSDVRRSSIRAQHARARETIQSILQRCWNRLSRPRGRRDLVAFGGPNTQDPIASLGLLSKLPGEIRNCIYELALYEPPETVELMKVKPPPKKLPLLSRQIHAESKAFYREAYRRFWRENHFTITLTPDNAQQTEDLISLLSGNLIVPQVQRQYGWVGFLRSWDVWNIRHLSVTNPHVTYTTRYVYCRGVLEAREWHRAEIMIPRVHAGALREAGFYVHSCPITPGWSMVPVQAWVVTGRNLPALSDADIEKVKRLAGKQGLTHKEIVAIVRLAREGS